MVRGHCTLDEIVKCVQVFLPSPSLLWPLGHSLLQGHKLLPSLREVHTSPTLSVGYLRCPPVFHGRGNAHTSLYSSALWSFELHPRMSWLKPSLNYTFIYPLNKLSLSFFVMPNTVLGNWGTAVSKNDTAHVLKELTFYVEARQTIKKYS